MEYKTINSSTIMNIVTTGNMLPRKMKWTPADQSMKVSLSITFIAKLYQRIILYSFTYSEINVPFHSRLIAQLGMIIVIIVLLTFPNSPFMCYNRVDIYRIQSGEVYYVYTNWNQDGHERYLRKVSRTFIWYLWLFIHHM